MKKRKFLNSTEIEKLINAIPEGQNYIRDRCMLLMCFIHGLRVSELQELRMQDVDMVNHCLSVSRLKNGTPALHPIQEREIEAINQWLALRPSYPDSDSEWLFLSRDGGKLSRQQLSRLINRYGELANLGVAVHPNMLRHACGYALAQSGVDIRVIQGYLGHKNIQNTAIYLENSNSLFDEVCL